MSKIAKLLAEAKLAAKIFAHQDNFVADQLTKELDKALAADITKLRRLGQQAGADYMEETE